MSLTSPSLIDNGDGEPKTTHDKKIWVRVTVAQHRQNILIADLYEFKITLNDHNCYKEKRAEGAVNR